MTLQALEIRFQANIEGAVAQLRVLTNALRSVEGAAAGMGAAGLRLSMGLAAGIRAGKGAVVRAANEVAQAAVSRIRAALQIRSPSRVAAEIGRNFSEGFALGVMDASARAALSAGALASAAGDGIGVPAVQDARAGDIASAVERALSGLSVAVPIAVDGVKLGEAAIRGINAVRRATGRQMLDI